MIEDDDLGMKLQAAVRTLDTRVKAERSDTPAAIAPGVVREFLASHESDDFIPVHYIRGS